MSSLREKLSNIWRDIKWAISTATRPDEDEFKLATRFLLFLAFIAGAFQIFFHIAGLYLNSVIFRQPLPTLGDPLKEAVAAMTSFIAIVAILIYLLIKLR
ncbi:MAG: hypothetical protein QXK67_00730 [Pyrobaculum sp.]